MAGQAWSIPAEGGYFSNPKLSKKLRTANQPRMVFRQFTRAEPAVGRGVGDTFDFDKVTNVQAGGGRIAEFQDIPETKYLIKRGQLVITEWGNSIPYSGKLAALSDFDPENPTQKALMNDMSKTLDIAVATELKTAKIIAHPTSTGITWDVDGTPSTTVTVPFGYNHLKDIVDAMSTGIFGASTLNPVPAFPDGNYVAIMSVKAARTMQDDPDYQEAAKFAVPRKLLAGELPDVVYNTRIVISNHQAALSNTKGTGNVLGEVIFIGDDSIEEGVAIKEELRAKVPVKYGRDRGIAWYALLEFQLIWDIDTDGEDHVVRVTSA